MSSRVRDTAARLVERQMALVDARERARDEVRAQRDVSPPSTRPATEPTITISRQYGAGGSDIAAALAAALDWPVYDRQLVEAVADDAHLQTRLLQRFDERAKRDMETLIDAFMSHGTISEEEYHRGLIRVLQALGKTGRAIIVGRGAHLILPPERTLRVRLYAPLDDRVARVVEREFCSPVEARSRIDRVEQARADWLRRTFRERAHEPVAFDLELNTSTLGTALCVQLLQVAVRELFPLAEAD